MVWRINAGGAGYTDSSGNRWRQDLAYTSGAYGFIGGKQRRTTASIASTVDDRLYRNDRHGTFAYQFDVPTGVYTVTMLFAELVHTQTGQRLFDVLIEDTPVLDNLDIYATVGHRTAMHVAFPGIVVDDGQLRLEFVAVQDQATVAAIEVQTEQP
jgi:hypothetical protein